MITFGSLFAGIGGLDLGLERAGMQCAWQVEINDYATRVLTKHWPDVSRFGDIRECGMHNLSMVDLVCGGFPCQDISDAGKQAGITGSRSGLWLEYARIIRELRPRYVLVENVSALLERGMGVVLADLATLGYDTEWDCLPAASVGAPHLRDRVFLLAYPTGKFTDVRNDQGQGQYHGVVPKGNHWKTQKRSTNRKLVSLVPGICERTPADWWRSQSRMDRSVDGVPYWVDRLRGLGNAVVPQVAEFIGRQIVAFDQEFT